MFNCIDRGVPPGRRPERPFGADRTEESRAVGSNLSGVWADRNEN